MPSFCQLVTLKQPLSISFSYGKELDEICKECCGALFIAQCMYAVSAVKFANAVCFKKDRKEAKASPLYM